jgi:hypothetical protein
MRPLLTLLVVTLLGAGVSACGGSGKSASSAFNESSSAVANGGAMASAGKSATRSPGGLHVDGDNDDDNPTKSLRDKDDRPPLPGSRPASAAERRVIARLVTGYYAAAAAADGVAACSRLYSIIAKAVPEDYGRPPGPPALRGKTCAVVMSKLFKVRRRELEAKSATLEVKSVRVRGDRAVALLRFGKAPERRVLLRREFGVWKMTELFDMVAVP